MNPDDPEARNAKVRNPEYNYFHDGDYCDYFLSDLKTVIPNPKIPESDV